MNPETPIEYNPKTQEEMDWIRNRTEQETDNQSDNEWINFMRELSENKSAKDIASFIDENSWTPRQQVKIKAYARVLLSDGISTTYIFPHIDYLSMLDDVELITCTIPFGMTVYDITPEFLTVMEMIKMQAKVGMRRSKNALFLNRLSTKSLEISHEERNRQQSQDVFDRAKAWIGWK